MQAATGDIESHHSMRGAQYGENSPERIAAYCGRWCLTTHAEGAK